MGKLEKLSEGRRHGKPGRPSGDFGCGWSAINLLSALALQDARATAEPRLAPHLTEADARSADRRPAVA